MTTETIPLSATPSQTLTTTVGAQTCRINVYQKRTGLFFDLFLADTPIAQGVVCLNKTRLVRAPYTGFVGDFSFVDTQGNADPDYTGLGSRFVLTWSDEL